MADPINTLALTSTSNAAFQIPVDQTKATGNNNDVDENHTTYSSSGPPTPTFSHSEQEALPWAMQQQEEQPRQHAQQENMPTTIWEKLDQNIKNIKHSLGSSTWTLPRFRLIAANMVMVAVGLHDAAAGALIPYAQTYYGISYMIVSLLFVSQCIGFLLASVANTFLSDMLGMGKVMSLGCILQAIGYSIVAPGLPFPAFCFGYGLSGFGIALQDAQANTYVAGLPGAATKLGWLHALYGLGGFASPLIATAMVEHGVNFNFYYLFLLGFALISFVATVASFRLKPDPQDYNLPQQPSSGADDDIEMTDTDQRQESTSTNVQEVKSSKKLKQILSSRSAIIASLFLLVYVGSEVSLGGWIVSFLLDHRDGNSSAGYVSSGFFGGLTLGRVALLKVTSLVGERNSVWLYLAISFGLEFVVWFAPNLVANSVAVSFVGFFLGPLYPIAVSVLTKILPRSLHAGAVGFCAAFGQTGSALFPFITGTLAQKFGVQVLHPMMLILMGVMSGVWLFMPRVSRRSE